MTYSRISLYISTISETEEIVKVSVVVLGRWTATIAHCYSEMCRRARKEEAGRQNEHRAHWRVTVPSWSSNQIIEAKKLKQLLGYIVRKRHDK
jgi:hypothetical protein